MARKLFWSLVAAVASLTTVFTALAGSISNI